jgi:hypothetical protein
MFRDKPTPAANVPTPPKGEFITFIDENGTPSIIDENRTVTPSATLDGGPVVFSEQVSPPPTAASVLKVFAVREDGELVLKVRDENNGDVSAIGGGALDILWKGGTPGNPFVDGDTATILKPDTMVMVDVAEAYPPPFEVVAIEFPPANAASKGKRVVIVNLQSKKDDNPGILHFVPDGTDTIGAGAAGETRSPVFVELENHIFISDGNGGWHPVAVGGTYQTFDEADPAPPP